jgi:hypothetical protein
MIPSRRLFSSSALVAVPLALAGCSTVAGFVNSPTVQAVINQIQAAMPAIELIAQGVAIAYPAAAAIIPVVEGALSTAFSLFQQLSASLSVSAAQPIAQQVVNALTQALNAISTALSRAPQLPALVTWEGFLAQAKAVVALIVSFVVPATVPVPALALGAPQLYVH